MVVKLIHTPLCDMHILLELGETPAEGSITISINGGQPKEFDLCTRCQVDLRPVIELYSSPGRRPDEAERKQAAKTRRRQVEPEPEPAKELPPARAGEAVRLYPTSTAKENLDKPHVVCTEPHEIFDGQKAAVRYKVRGTHASTAHNKQVWEITWEDPDGILTVPCTEHVVCKENGVKFTSPQGLSQHRLKHAPAA